MKRPVIFTLCAAASLLIIALCVMTGSIFITPWTLSGSSPEVQGLRDLLYHLRLPRTLAAFSIGGALSVSGALFQSLLRNPLADPYTIGVSGGASLGASIAIIIGLGYPSVAGFSLAGGIAVALAVSAFARRRDSSQVTVILAGISLSLILSSGVTLLFALAESRSVHKALLWLMGDMSMARIEYLLPTGAAVILLIIASFFYAPHLDLLSYGTHYAKSSGVSRGEISVIFWLASLLSSLAVSLCGVVGFVGLIIPHLARRITGPGHRLLVPASALFGGTFLALCDTIGRTLSYPYEVPSGVITGLAGGVFLLIMLVKGKR